MVLPIQSQWLKPGTEEKINVASFVKKQMPSPFILGKKSLLTCSLESVRKRLTSGNREYKSTTFDQVLS